MFEVFEHTADLGIRARARSLEELFAEAARGLIAQLANLDAVQRVSEKSIELASDSLEYLLFDWLSELLYAFEESRLLLSEFDVQIKQTGEEFKLRAVARGEVADAARHELDHEVKAITYHGLLVEQQPGGDWLAEVIVDI
ncbi:archease [Anatilimnocola floriformis]|uniref:archease n=1 Tax=Anatilimnocola floriformis TaxID=2948575 RepID=UPI0020C26BFE|nr:archease [Anatilimnocola floriformis]